MSIVETLQRAANTNGSAKIHRRTAKEWPQDSEAKARANRAETTPSVADLQRQRNLAIQNDAYALLRNSSYYPLRNVSCEVRQCVVTLSGRVPSFHMKQMAQTIVRRLLDGGIVINNQLEVDRT